MILLTNKDGTLQSGVVKSVKFEKHGRKFPGDCTPDDVTYINVQGPNGQDWHLTIHDLSHFLNINQKEN